jgi:hypothetical protein
MDQSLRIFCQDNSELSEFEASSRGYRSDIFVGVNSKNYYHLNVYDIVRLKQDFDSEINYYGFFGIEPNVILVNKVTLKEIKYTVEMLFRQNYFDKIKPASSDQFDIENLIEV